MKNSDISRSLILKLIQMNIFLKIKLEIKYVDSKYNTSHNTNSKQAKQAKQVKIDQLSCLFSGWN